MHAPQSAPMGVLGICRACGAETSIRLIEPMDARDLERRTFERKACRERHVFIISRVNEITRVMGH
jgi:hypothetical protein